MGYGLRSRLRRQAANCCVRGRAHTAGHEFSMRTATLPDARLRFSLLRHARATKGVTLMEFTTSVDLLTEEIDGVKTVVGAVLLDRDGKLKNVLRSRGADRERRRRAGL